MMLYKMSTAEWKVGLFSGAALPAAGKQWEPDSSVVLVSDALNLLVIWLPFSSMFQQVTPMNS